MIYCSTIGQFIIPGWDISPRTLNETKPRLTNTNQNVDTIEVKADDEDYEDTKLKLA